MIREKISFSSFLSSLFPSAILKTLFNRLDVDKIHLHNLSRNGEGGIVNFALINAKNLCDKQIKSLQIFKSSGRQR